MKILIIGGSRFVGPVLIDLLIKNGHTLTVFNRGGISDSYPEGIRFVKGDRNKGFGVKDTFDCVIDMCAYRGEQTQTALKELQFDYFLHFGTVAAYKKTDIFPITEESEIGDWPSFGDYGKGKVECERVLEKSGAVHAIIRPVYIMGPKNYCDREHFIYSRIKREETLILPGNGQGLTQFVFVDEVAKIIAMLVEKKIPGAFNVSGNEIISLTGLVEEMGKIIGKKPIIQFNPQGVGSNFNEEEFPFDNESVIVANEKIKKTLDFRFLPLLTGLRRDYANYYQKTV